VIEAARAGDIAQARADAVITVVVARGLALHDEERGRILTERDLRKLEVWLVRAATCATTAELLDDIA
jgi:hypothetical protein